MPEPVSVLALCQFRFQSLDALLQVIHLRRPILLHSCSIWVHGSLHSHLSGLGRVDESPSTQRHSTQLSRSHSNIDRVCDGLHLLRQVAEWLLIWRLLLRASAVRQGCSPTTRL